MTKTRPQPRLFPLGSVFGLGPRAESRRRARSAAIASLGAATLAAALTLAPAGCGSTVSDASLRPIAASEFSQRFERSPNSILLIDTRSASDFAAGTIPGARNITLLDVPPDVDTDRFDGYSLVVVFGDNPASATARAVAKRLMRAGVGNVYFYEGGYQEWTRRGT